MIPFPRRKRRVPFFDLHGTSRLRMVEGQIAARGITRPDLLDAMRRIPRHEFIPRALAASAYEDRALPIGLDQTISQPFMTALMTDALAPRRGLRVLEVGTGSGYQAALLAWLGTDVLTIERLPPLALRAQATLLHLGFGAVRQAIGDGSRGRPAEAPFDRILVTAGAPAVPPGLADQLADGGRLVIPVGGTTLQDLLVIERTEGRFRETARGACAFVPLLGSGGWKP
jgi:protein-L-isoaspartate(D-aspartate) O-methyltransferase